MSVDDIAKRVRCPFCEAQRLRVDVKIFEWSDYATEAEVTIICDGCHKTIFEKGFQA